MEPTDRIPVTEMTTLIESRTAHELLDFVRLGPVEYAGRWWYIAADAEDKTYYTPASTELAATFAEQRDRLARVDELARRYG